MLAVGGEVAPVVGAELDPDVGKVVSFVDIDSDSAETGTGSSGAPEQAKKALIRLRVGLLVMWLEVRELALGRRPLLQGVWKLSSCSLGSTSVLMYT